MCAVIGSTIVQIMNVLKMSNPLTLVVVQENTAREDIPQINMNV